MTKKRRVEASSSEDTRRDAGSLWDWKDRWLGRRGAQEIGPVDVPRRVEERPGQIFEEPLTIGEARAVTDRLKGINTKIGQLEYQIRRSRGEKRIHAEEELDELLQQRVSLNSVVPSAKSFIHEWSNAESTVSEDEMRQDGYLASLVTEYWELKTILKSENVKKGDSRYARASVLRDQISDRVMRLRRG